MRVFVTGGTGFVGGHVVRALIEKGHEVGCLVRRGSERKLRGFSAIPVPGDVLDGASLTRAMDGADALIHLVGIIREFPSRGITFERLHVEATRNVLHAAREAGVARYLHMSANGTRPGAPSPYHRTKWLAEELVRGSEKISWTIFRPSVIFGPGDAFVTMLAQMVRKAPFVPVVGTGLYQLQPVAVQTVAQGFALALEKEATVGQTYGVCGPEPMSFNEVLDAIGLAITGGRPRKLHLPLAPMRFAAGLLGRFPWFPLTTAQITMLLEGNACDSTRFHRDLGLTPIPFREHIGRCVQALGNESA